MKTDGLIIFAALAMSIGIAQAAPLAPSSAAATKPKPVVSGNAGYVAKTERGRLAQQIVRKWAGYVQEVYGTAPMAWSKAMNSTFAQVDMGNLRAAAKFQTYEAMSASLLGQKTSDHKVIDVLARDSSQASLKSLGSQAEDLVYTPIYPCRIVDTRLRVGYLSPNIIRSFYSHGASFVTQGGSETNCNLPADPSALMLNVTVLALPTGSRYSHIRLYPYGAPVPKTVSLFFYTPSQRISNELVVKMTTGQPLNFSAISGLRTHLVIDVAGYFMAPVATALDCTRAKQTLVIAPGSYADNNSECPQGYSVTGGGCIDGIRSGVPLRIDVSGAAFTGNSWVCEATNNDTAARTLNNVAVCCRIPGR